MTIFLALLTLAFAGTPKDSMTKGFKIEAETKGDLNGDGIEDLALILSPPAQLRIYFGDREGSYTLQATAEKAVCLQCGGVKGAEMPFDIEVKKGVLSLTLQGGSRYMYATTTKWRFQKGEFALIGVTSVNSDTVDPKKGALWSFTRDANLSTGKMTEKVERVAVVTEGDPKTMATEKKCSVPAKYKAITLKTYDLEAFETPQCSKLAF